ncbi:MAG: response regulator [Planctomycetes bacterium]|nr:response regulator [Planctomycetota bacterium]NUQ34644.1 response regulator [Planctomycetaceae bacterium]
MKDETILVIDDSPTIRRLLSHSLKNLGYSIVLAEDGLQGLEKLSVEDIDIVIVDLNMPNMDGLEFTREVRASTVHRDMPIIMLTTESSEQDRARGLSAGVNTYLVKPTSPEKLNYKVRALLDAKKTL